MPEVKQFIYNHVLENEYEGLSVKFIPGAMPELIMYSADDKELSREAIKDMALPDLHKFVQSKGFKRTPKGKADEEPQEEEEEEAEEEHEEEPDEEEEEEQQEEL